MVHYYIFHYAIVVLTPIYCLFMQLARSSHLGEKLVEGEFRGLDKDVSAITVATALHEQFNWLDSITPTGLQIANTEISRHGLRTDGIQESVLRGWNRLSDATKQYSEILEVETPATCQRSGLTTAHALQLYASNFDSDSTLSICDQIFLQAYNSDTSKRCVMRYPHIQNGPSERFVKKAALLGIVITPHDQRHATIPPPLFHSEQQQSLSQDFEQINEDMFSRRDNKFMVFNGCAVDSWSGTQSITKTQHLPRLTDDSL